MYHSLLDWWDERQAQRGDELKETSPFSLDTELAFPKANEPASLADFCEHSDRALLDKNLFTEPKQPDRPIEWETGWIRFPSSIVTDVVENNRVWAKVTDSRSSDRALLVFHHWNATSRNPQLANYFARQGMTVIEMALPFHLERQRPSSSYADYMLSPSLGRTLQSMRQAVLDGRGLIRILRREGYKDISVLGMSLGAWVAGLIAAHDPSVRKAALLLIAGSLADMVWTGRATRHIRASLEPHIALNDLRKVWGPLSLNKYAEKLARTDLDLLLVLAKRDTVVLPELSIEFLSQLEAAQAKPQVLNLNCGHYSLAKPPYLFSAGSRLASFLRAD